MCAKGIKDSNLWPLPIHFCVKVHFVKCRLGNVSASAECSRNDDKGHGKSCCSIKKENNSKILEDLFESELKAEG
jgi:hypothetical protein